jgi:hypothetical protein
MGTDLHRSAVIARSTQRAAIHDAERQKPRYHAERGNDETMNEMRFSQVSTYLLTCE